MDTYNQYSKLIYKICAKYQYVNKLHTLEDLISESYIPFLYAYKHYDSSKSNFTTYLHMATTHHLLKVVNGINDEINDTSSLNVPISEDHEVVDLIEDDNTIDFIEVLFQSELKQLLREKMEELLTLKEKEVLHYYYWDNLSQESISNIYGYSKSNVQRYLNQALRKLKRDQEIQRFYKDNINENYKIVFPK